MITDYLSMELNDMHVPIQRELVHFSLKGVEQLCYLAHKGSTIHCMYVWTCMHECISTMGIQQLYKVWQCT